jgi:hypothetical protein
MNVKQRLKQMAHSMQWRLVALFILLALAMTAAFIGGTQRSFASGWREAIRPVLGDYIDRLASGCSIADFNSHSRAEFKLRFTPR